MIKKKNAILTALFAVVASIAACIVVNQPVHAEMAEVAQKWIFSQYYHCLQSADLTKEFSRKKDGLLSDSIFNGLTGKTEAWHNLPSEDYFTSVGEDSINCRQVLSGIDGKISGVLEAAGAKYNATWKDLSDVDDVLAKLGYKAEDAATETYFKIMLSLSHKNSSNHFITKWNSHKETFIFFIIR